MHVHILAICGYTTSGLALMAKALGYKVTGSDEDAYPPGSTRVTQAKIPWRNFHDPRNLTQWGRPDLVIQGNQIRRGNLELAEAEKRGLPIISDSEFFYRLTLDRQRIVVCGSHGKTTTAALLAWILTVAGREPGFRLGAITKNFKKAVELGKGQPFIFEGDEYTTTFKDKRPKFFHFHPNTAIINNIEYDHPDVFKTKRSYLKIFKKYLVEEMPKNGLLVVNGEDKNVVKVSQNGGCFVVSFGFRRGEFQARNLDFDEGKTLFSVYEKGKLLDRFETRLVGEHNVKNCLAAITVSRALGVTPGEIKKALKTFKGISRRFEVVGVKGGITVVDDYAHHPTKARETIAAAKKRFPRARIFALYVPHTYSRTQALLKEYSQAFAQANFVVIADIEAARERHLKALIHARDLVKKIKKFHRRAFYLSRAEKIIDFVKERARLGDVVLCMSVGGFDNMAKRMLNQLG